MKALAHTWFLHTAWFLLNIWFVHSTCSLAGTNQVPKASHIKFVAFDESLLFDEERDRNSFEIIATAFWRQV